jgi:hypothetical protein
MIFVFGSNLAGRHGKGAALFAKLNYGAEYGVGEGLTGNAYAIPTKDKNLRPRTLREVALSVEQFLEYATSHPWEMFLVTPIGTGLAGFTKKEIANIFQTRELPSNIVFSKEWME